MFLSGFRVNASPGVIDQFIKLAETVLRQQIMHHEAAVTTKHPTVLLVRLIRARLSAMITCGRDSAF
jgi:hypothetical protein